MVPVSDRSRSARVDLPWSMWATMEKFRISAVGIETRIACPGRRSGGDFPGPHATDAPCRLPEREISQANERREAEGRSGDEREVGNRAASLENRPRPY